MVFPFLKCIIIIYSFIYLFLILLLFIFAGGGGGFFAWLWKPVGIIISTNLTWAFLFVLAEMTIFT